MQQGDPAQIEELKKELQRKEEEAKSKGLPFNSQAYLRRMAQGKNQYYDSAEYVLKNGWPSQNQQQQAAYFNKDIPHEAAKAVNTGVNRFKTQAQPQDDDDDDE
ncbi:Conserved_hypothetical protein [Hexamita inflata]|uniref:Uncharacterized protein n=1 Tax=Hexamita inflata TaxID=28002 RepID=A0AA86RNB0_9EUKA|nr:Conserved hypothetical protein [Hexamita inflata]CAI9975017.1 Conserved hypothetical protein [Hexamita inflata]CAI9976061.1 Conserved hypothetical protein [Hexamita inflata]